MDDSSHYLKDNNQAEEKNELLLEDFPPNSLIHLVAKKDINLAIQILEKCGGQKTYFPKIDSIRRKARDRLITELRIQQELPKDIAKEFGLSKSRIRRIIKRGLDRRFGVFDFE